MPLISIYKLSDADLHDNKNVLFVYADHRKQVGDPDVNHRFRDMANALPLVIKKHGGTSPESFWKESELDAFKNEFTNSYDKIIKVLGGTNERVYGVLCRESLDHDDFSIDRIKEHSVEVYKHVAFTLSRFHTRYSPIKLEGL